MSNFITNFVKSISEDPDERDQAIRTHMNNAKFNANSRVIEESFYDLPKGYHRQDKFTRPYAGPELPRGYNVPSHPEDGSYDTYAANSYASAIALTDILAKREL